MGLYDRIKEVATKQNVTIYRLEKDLGLSNGSISKWNNSIPFSTSLIKVANYLGTTVEFLTNDSEEEWKGERT